MSWSLQLTCCRKALWHLEDIINGTWWWLELDAVVSVNRWVASRTREIYWYYFWRHLCIRNCTVSMFKVSWTCVQNKIRGSNGLANLLTLLVLPFLATAPVLCSPPHTVRLSRATPTPCPSAPPLLPTSMAGAEGRSYAFLRQRRAWRKRPWRR